MDDDKEKDVVHKQIQINTMFSLLLVREHFYFPGVYYT
jgi:hypothetical protein